MINYPYSLPHTREVRQTILDNPECPLVIMVDEDTYTGEYPTEVVEVFRCYVTEMASFHGRWCDADDLEEIVANALADDEGYAHLTDDEFEELVKKTIANYPVQKVIAVSL